MFNTQDIPNDEIDVTFLAESSTMHSDLVPSPHFVGLSKKRPVNGGFVDMFAS